MADEAAPVADAPATDAPAAPAAPPQGEDGTKRALDSSEAGRILARARGSFRKPGKETATEGKASTATPGTATGAAPPSDASSSASGSTPPSKTEAKAEEAKAEAKPEDEAATRLATLVREDRRIKAERTKLDTERKAHEADVVQVRAMREAREKGDKLGMLAAAFPGEDLAESVFWDLLQGLKEKEAPEPFDPAKVPELVEASIKARDEAAAKARQEAAQRDVETASNAYAEACAAELKANADKYPLVRRRGVSSADVDKYVRSVYAQTRAVPEADAVLAHFEGRFVRDLEGTPYAPKAPAPAPVSPTVSGQWTQDSRGQTQPEGKGPTLQEKTEALRERLRSLDRQRAGGQA